MFKIFLTSESGSCEAGTVSSAHDICSDPDFMWHHCPHHLNMQTGTDCKIKLGVKKIF